MKEIIRYSFTLALICIIAAFLLSVVNFFTQPKILAQIQANEESALKEVMPSAKSFEAIKSGGETIYYKALDKEGNLIGVAFKASGKGYSSVIDTMVGMSKDGTIASIKVLNQNETPGLGNQVAGPGFSERFRGRKDLADIQAITGATISSEAVINSVNKKAKEVREFIKDGK